jgi:hypothetical protein
MHIKFWWGKLLKNCHLEIQGVKDNIRMDLRETGTEYGRWVKLAWDHGLVFVVLNL